MYNILALIILAISMTIIFSNPKSELRRWFGAFMFFAGLGVLSIATYRDLFWYVPSGPKAILLGHLHYFLFTESNYFMPYTLFMFSILLLGAHKGTKDKRMMAVKLTLLVPIVFMHYLFPSNLYYDQKQFIAIYTPWSLAYFLLAEMLSIYACIKERDQREKIRKIIVCFAVTVIVSIMLIVGYFLPAKFQTTFYELHQLAIPFILLILSIVTLKYGILGYKLKIEKGHYHSMMDSMTPGAAVLNHSIKNEIMKMAVCVHNLKSTSKVSEEPFWDENLKVMQNSIEHLTEMTNRIKVQMQGFELNEKANRMNEIIEGALSMVQPYMQQNKIQIKQSCSSEIVLLCDEVHMKEVLINLLMNSAEAIEKEGIIDIRLFMKSRGIMLLIKDNGKGISPKDMPFVLNPFFTTKKHRYNYGLGLSYCYNVMKKHGGRIEIISKKDIGTEVSLFFPHERVLQIERTIAERKGDYGENKTDACG